MSLFVVAPAYCAAHRLRKMMRFLVGALALAGIVAVAQSAGDDSTAGSTTLAPTTPAPTTQAPAAAPTTSGPTTLGPTAATTPPTTRGPTAAPTPSEPPTNDPTTSPPSLSPTLAPITPLGVQGLACGQTQQGSTFGQASFYGEPSGDARYEFSVAYVGEHAFLACDSSFDTMLRIFPKENADPANPIFMCDDCGDCGGRTSIVSGVTPGFNHLAPGDYLIVLDGYRLASGSFKLEMRCRTQSPTAEPTRMPSAAPSTAPSRAPTGTPSRSTTMAPTPTPTAVPSSTPTLLPTMSPSNTTVPEAATEKGITEEWNATIIGLLAAVLVLALVVVGLASHLNPKPEVDDTPILDEATTIDFNVSGTNGTAVRKNPYLTKAREGEERQNPVFNPDLGNGGDFGFGGDDGEEIDIE